MKKLLLLIFLAVTINLIGCTNAQSPNAASGNNKVKIMVYYFHGTHRCPGCIAGEDVTVKSLNSLYKEKMDLGIIQFQSINLDEEKNKALAEKYQISWSSLLIVKQSNGKEEKVDLTEQSFSFARTDPGKLKTIIQLTIDKMLNG